jgi:hypothetical protein
LVKNLFPLEMISFVIFRDSTTHRSHDKNTIISVNQNFTQELRKYFPKTLIIPVVGKLIFF